MNPATAHFLTLFSAGRDLACSFWKKLRPAATQRMARPDEDFLHLPKPLLAQLVEVRRRLLVRRLVLGCVKVMCLGLLCLLAQTIWDWFAGLTVPLRAVLLLLDCLVLGAAGWIFLWLPVRNRESLEACALILERRIPTLRSALISAVQFSRQTPDPLMQLAIKEAGETLKTVRLAEVLPVWAPLQRPVLAMLVAVAGLLCAAFVWPTVGVLVSRVALSSRPLPAETTIRSVSGNLTVEAGESLTLEIRAEGVLPKSGRFEVLGMKEPSVFVPALQSGSEPGCYGVTLPNVQESFRYRAFVKGAVSPIFQVNVLTFPTVSSVRFTRFDPPYMNNPATVIEPGSLTVAAGGRLGITGRATQALSSALVKFQNGETRSLDVNETDFSGEVDIPGDGGGGFEIVVQNTESIPSRKNTRHRLRVLRDEAPKISWLAGGEERRTIVAETKPRLAFSVSDNFQVTAVWLVAAVETENGKREEVRVPITIPGPAGGYEFEETLHEPAKLLPWNAGTAITYWIEAADNNDATGPGIGRSSAREWLIVSGEQKKEDLFERLDHAARKIHQISENQKTLRKVTEERIQP